MILQILILVLGFVLLIKGADILVDGASCAARNIKISSIVIGLTIVAFGTSAPELAVSFKAMASGSGDIVLGNVIGSNIANVLLILGVASLFCNLEVKNDTIKKEIPITILISLLIFVLFSDILIDGSSINSISRSDGVVILLFFTIFAYYLYTIIRRDKNLKKNELIKDSKPKYKLGISLLLILIGLVAIIFGSDLVVDNAIKIAGTLGVSERIISFSIIALGTSLPELVTAVASAKKGEQDILIGNVVGSNIFNMGIVLALPVAIFGGFSCLEFSYMDLIMLVLSSIILFLFAKDDKKISKLEGLLMITIFITYYAYIFLV